MLFIEWLRVRSPSLRRSPRWKLWTAVLAAFLFSARNLFAPSALCGDVDIGDIIANVRSNEALYENIEITMLREYTLFRKPLRSPNEEFREIVEQNRRVRYVTQNGMFHLDVKGLLKHADDDDFKRKDRIRLFDGATSRALGNRAANIVPGPTLDENMIRPHMLLLQNTGYAVPLSTYMQGHDAMSAYPGQTWKSDRYIETEYLGEDMFDGRPCQKVAIRHVAASSGKATIAWILWLATDRNYIPIRREGYKFMWSKDIPVGEGFARDLREIAPGVWFPFEAEIVVYDMPHIRAQQQQKADWRRRFTVETVTLDPSYPVQFFRHLDIPDGTAVYHLDADGNITKSYFKGAPGAPGGATAGAVRRWWFVWANVGVVLAVVAVVFIMRRRSRRKASGGG